MFKSFDYFAKKISEIVGTASMFAVSLGILILWFLSGFLMNFSDTWQLIINTTTSIITFLMVFLIQHTQNRDAKTMQIKLDELIRVNTQAHNSLLNLDKLSDKQITDLENKFKELSKQIDSEVRYEEFLEKVDE